MNSRGTQRALLPVLSIAALASGYVIALPAAGLDKLAAGLASGENEGLIYASTVALVVGGLLSWPLAAAADRIGRKPVIAASTLMFGILSAAASLTTDVVTFATLQVGVRTFAGAALVVSAALLIEESSDETRGRAVGQILGTARVGLLLAVGAAGLVPGFRPMLLLGAIAVAPGILAARTLREGYLFEGIRHAPKPRAPFGQLGATGMMFFLLEAGVLGGAIAWRRFALVERRMATADLHIVEGAALLVGALGYLVAGWVSDRLGRRRAGAALLFIAAAGGTAAFGATNRAAMVVSALIAVSAGFGASAVATAVAGELPASSRRAGSLGLVKGPFGALGAVAGPLGWAVLTPRIGPFKASLALMSLLGVAAVVMLGLPETSRRSLESISAAAEIPSGTGFAFMGGHPAPAPVAPAGRDDPPDDRSPSLHAAYAARRPKFREAMELAKSAGLEGDLTAADLGCGAGVTTAAILEKLGPDGHVFAVDYSEAILSVARSRVNDPRTTFVESGPEEVASKIGVRVDRVVCSSLWWQMGNDAALTAAGKLVRESGKLIFDLPEQLFEFDTPTPAGHKFARLVETMIRLAREDLSYGGPLGSSPGGRVGLRDVETLLTRHGFHLESFKESRDTQEARDLYEWLHIPSFARIFLPRMSFEEKMGVLENAFWEVFQENEVLAGRWGIFVAARGQLT